MITQTASLPELIIQHPFQHFLFLACKPTQTAIMYIGDKTTSHMCNNNINQMSVTIIIFFTGTVDIIHIFIGTLVVVRLVYSHLPPSLV